MRYIGDLASRTLRLDIDDTALIKAAVMAAVPQITEPTRAITKNKLHGQCHDACEAVLSRVCVETSLSAVRQRVDHDHVETCAPCRHLVKMVQL
jgi:hypothetical protein